MNFIRIFMFLLIFLQKKIDAENNRKMEVFFGVPKKLKKKAVFNEIKESFGEKILKIRNIFQKNEENEIKYQKFMDFKLKIRNMSNKQPNLYYIKHLKLKILPFELVFLGKPIDNLYKFYRQLAEILKVNIYYIFSIFFNFSNFLSNSHFSIFSIF